MEKVRARALEVHALTEERAPWTDSFRERALEVHGRALKVRAQALEVWLWPHEFFPSALFRARASLSGMAPSPSRARRKNQGMLRAQKRARARTLREGTEGRYDPQEGVLKESILPIYRLRVT